MSPRATPVRVAAAVAALGLLAGCAGTSASGGPDGSGNRFVAGDGNVQKIRPENRKAGPQASGTTLKDEQLKLSDLRGKVTVVNFWASWCAPCRGEAPSLQRVHTEQKPNGVEFVGVNFKDSKANAQAFDRRFGITYPSWFDADGQIGLAFRDIPPDAIPSTLVLDRQGRVAARIIGSTTYSRLTPVVTEVLAER
ncbi:TlpA family protein disulfide reductase [Actinomadura flavalba]|uniref:TlpA family protein disulfide reductase n=1 Tax=Actinomadura flavalba TaxID=1120938 RepID=UPI0003745B53|nr:TlpA disulfide reductase family protein [Actinomadura flavalba]